MRDVLVIGGTLFIGRELVPRLLERGDRVTILHRGKSQVPAGVREILCDRNNTGAIEHALPGHKFDLVFDNVYDWERGTTAAQVTSTAAACGEVSRYIFVSSVAAYGGGENCREDCALATGSDDLYVRNKSQSEIALFQMHRESGLPVATVRPPFVYGPDNPYYREAFFWDRILRGRPIIVPEDGHRLMHFVYVKDLVWAMLRIAESTAAVGQPYNIADERPLTQTQVVEALAATAGMEPKIVFVPRAAIEAAGGGIFRPPFYFGEYFDLPPITESVEKARRDLGFHPARFETGLAETYQSYLSKPRPEPDFSWEDRLLRGC